MKTVIVRLSGDVTYRKRRSRLLFERLVAKNIKEALIKEGINAKVKWKFSRILIEGDLDNLDFLKRIFGISNFSPSIKINFEKLDDLSEKIKEIYKDKVKDKTFAVRCSRAGKHDFNSMQASQVIGSKLYPFSKGVNLNNPDIEINVEIRGQEAYVFEEKYKGAEGLPIGSGDNVLSLFSGGFDSPVASWYVAKRGCKVDFVHFSMGSLNDVQEVFFVAKFLSDEWFYGHDAKFYVVKFQQVIKDIMRNLDPKIWQVALRRAMYLASEKIALNKGYEALVVGESIAQATSQTVRNIRVAEEGISLPILRPLIGLDKREIIEHSKKIGTYDLSLKVEELCAIAIGPLTPRVDLNKFRNEFSRIEESINESLKSLMEIDINKVKEEDIQNIFKEEEFTISFIPKDAVIVNLMPEKFKIPNSISIMEFSEEKYKDLMVIFVCERGLTSKGLANYYRSLGIKAYSLEKGFEGYKNIMKEIS